MSTRPAASSKAWVTSHWPLIRKIGIALFVVLVLVMLALAISRVQWDKVLGAIQELPASIIGWAALVTALSYVVYSSFDLLGKYYTGHALAVWRTMKIGFISYAFTMSLGAPVGGLGLRLRLYSKNGLERGVIMRIMGLSLTTNWIGYLLLAGFVFAFGGVQLPSDWALGNGALRLLGAVMALAGVAYILLCAFSRKRSWTIRGHELELPPVGMALIQMVLAIANWSLIGAVIYILLQGKVDYFSVLGILLISAIAGAVAHVPAGLGVIESVFIAMLSGSLADSQILGALLVYRAIYYLAPLLLAGIWYLGTEAKMEISDSSAS